MNHSIISSPQSPVDTDIAIIGLAGRFPGARTIHEFWQNLRNGVETISFFSDEELEASGINSELLRNPQYIKAKGMLADVDLFDASFFGFSPKEAALIDPQQRVFLECSWEALEHAGIDTEHTRSVIGLYAGASMSTYLLYNLYANATISSSGDSHQIILGNDKDQLTTRVAYKLNLKGPCIGVQTACSTSLVAVHLACQGLLSGECDIAMAGGVAISLPQKGGYFYQDHGIASPDGHCRTFDQQANGTLRGDGVGLVVLKLLTNAITDGDTIHAIIKGSAINNDGSAKIGYTAPGIEGQMKVIHTAHVIAGIDPATISYIETHGTGTSLGDPAEVTALTKAFNASAQNHHQKQSCALGSVKTNIGHLDAAAGIAGLIKTVLALEHKELPPSLHYKHPNPNLHLEKSPFYINTTTRAWKTSNTPRRAGVSSFGIGGTNAHVILEEAFVPRPSNDQERSYSLLTLSARTSTALETMTDNLVQHLKLHPDLSLNNVAYTLQIGRKAFDYRRVAICQDLTDTITTLESRNPQRLYTGLKATDVHSVVFMFPGQGTQHLHMAADLYQHEPLFREHLTQCASLLSPLLGYDLLSILFPHPEQAEQTAHHLTQTALTQPVLFSLEYCLAQLWMAWGIHPQAMIGHSIGEYVAACLAGVFSLPDALRIVTLRGRLMQHLPAGSMLSVPLAEADLLIELDSSLSLAAVNAPHQVVISGPHSSIDALAQRLALRGVTCRKLHTSHAFHSQMMEPMLAPFQAELERVPLTPPRIPFISNSTGTWITPQQATSPIYWAMQARQTVRFGDGLHTLQQEEESPILLEVGPGQTLSQLARQQVRERGRVIPSLPHAQSTTSDLAQIQEAVGRLWLAGCSFDWTAVTHQRQRVPLPTYPFERQRYWIETAQPLSGASSQHHSLHKQSEITDGPTLMPQYHPRAEGSLTYVAPTNELERSIAAIWEDLLGIKPIGIHDSFFELGGHSLLATQLAARLREKVQVEVSLRDLLEASTIARLVDLIETLHWAGRSHTNESPTTEDHEEGEL